MLTRVTISGIATLINRLKKKSMTIAIDGSLYRFHPRFHNLMVLKIKELVNPGHKVVYPVLSKYMLTYKWKASVILKKKKKTLIKHLAIELKNKFCWQVIPCILQFKLTLSHDGSGKGAALVAAVATRLLDKKQVAEWGGCKSIENEEEESCDCKITWHSIYYHVTELFYSSILFAQVWKIWVFSLC